METEREQTTEVQAPVTDALEEKLTLEDDLAAELGLNRDEMRRQRRAHLVEGVTWLRKNKRLWLTEEGVRLIKEAMGVRPEPVLERRSEAEGETLRVLRIPRNARILEAEKKDGGVVRVRVSSNVNFVPGMEIKARTEGPYGDVMTLEGRCPRFRGRW